VPESSAKISEHQRLNFSCCNWGKKPPCLEQDTCKGRTAATAMTTMSGPTWRCSFETIFLLHKRSLSFGTPLLFIHVLCIIHAKPWWQTGSFLSCSGQKNGSSTITGLTDISLLILLIFYELNLISNLIFFSNEAKHLLDALDGRKRKDFYIFIFFNFISNKNKCLIKNFKILYFSNFIYISPAD
jgi:hypothetical protein